MPAPSYLTPAIRDIAARLHRAGFRCLVVGGAVRDAQLGRAGKDVDLATDATPEQVAKIFPNHRGTTRFGTTLLPADGELIELTTFRDEADYDDFRRPSQVRFVSDPIEDLSRRDFTINAMAYDIPTGQLIDPFGGASDLRARRLRAVGNPAERFGEDALRMLRAVRFASQLDFSIEPATAAAISKCAPNLAHLSAERIGVELDKLLAGRAAGRSLRETDRLGLTRHVLPELAGRLEHPAKIIERTGILAQSARWAALFCHQQPAAAAKRITAIALGAQMAGEVAGVLRVLELTTSAAGTDVDRSRVLRRLERQTMMTGLALAQACRAVGGPTAASALASLEALLASGRPLRLAELAVNGDDLLRAGGRAPGPWLGEALNRLLDEASAGRVANERGALLARLYAGREPSRAPSRLAQSSQIRGEGGTGTP